MITLPDISEIELFGVVDRGIAGQERIVMRINSSINIGEYGIILGMSQGSPGVAVPIYDHFFWFGVGTVTPTQWIHLYTGEGIPDKGVGSVSKEDIFNVYWGKEKTIFDLKTTVPILIRIGAVIVEKTNKTLIASQK